MWRDDGLAARLEAEAADLRRRFNADFWNQERGHYVLALDASKRQVDAMTSNAGHLLWSGIVDEERASATVERLMAPDMFSGWGIRTMSTNDAGYNPIEYHNGTVWPHDTGLIAEGFRRYGFREQASHLALALIDASAYFDYRLPEVFAGFPRGETGFPVEYPTASRPPGLGGGRRSPGSTHAARSGRGQGRSQCDRPPARRALRSALGRRAGAGPAGGCPWWRRDLRLQSFLAQCWEGFVDGPDW